MSYPVNYELMVGQQQAFQNIRAEDLMKSLYCGQPQTTTQHLFPGFQTIQNGVGTNMVHAAGHIPNLLHSKQAPVSRPLTATSTSSLQSQQKRFRPPQKSQKYIPKPIPLELGNLKTYSNPDILICGNCRDLFDDLVDMLDHKKNYCKMRFTCKCEEKEESCIDHDSMPQRRSTNSASSSCDQSTSKGTRVWLRCSQCKKSFNGAWDLIFHVQNAHLINICTLGGNDQKTLDENTVTAKSPQIQDNPPVNPFNTLAEQTSDPQTVITNN